ncbi:MAG TPA: DNA mismatch repair protein MutT [Lachnospiraceae bacterium]|nr:DNA mismatch repair protein MutT [Lachnospiraceae bacterium]
MKNTTLCYIKQNDKYLMLHRTKKSDDPNEGKWIGIGGHTEDGESPEECVLREVREETGLRLTEFRYRALITFVSDVYETEYMHLYTASAYDGRLINECNEGELQWVPVDQIMNLPMWEGDKLFLPCIMDESNGFFSMKLVYEGDRLVKHTLYEY